MNETSKRFRSRLTLLAGAVFLSACAGENLFTLSALSGSGPEIEIIQPMEADMVNLGDSVLVQATINSTVSLGSVMYDGVYVSNGNAAYTGWTEIYAGITNTTGQVYLTALASQVAGEVYIVVEATDRAGTTSADSVKITIN